MKKVLAVAIILMLVLAGVLAACENSKPAPTAEPDRAAIPPFITYGSLKVPSNGWIANDGTLTQSGASTFSGTTTFSGDVTLGGDGLFSNPVEFADIVTVTAAATFTDTVAVDGAVELGDDLVVAGDAYITGRATITGTTALNGQFTVADAAIFNGTADFNEATSLDGTVAVSGPTTHTNDVTISTIADGGNAGEKYELTGLVRVTMIALGSGKAATETLSLMDDSPTGEWAPLNANTTEAADTSIYRVGSASYSCTFTETAVNLDGCGRSISSDNWEANESVGFWIYVSTGMDAGDLALQLVDATETTTYTLPALSRLMWHWVEIDVSALAGGNGDAITAVRVILTTPGAGNLDDEFTIYLDDMWKWDADNETSLSESILMDGLLSLVGMPDQDLMSSAFVNYSSTAADAVVFTADTRAYTVLAMVAY